MSDLTNASQEIYDYFQKEYGGDTGNLRPDSLFFAFERLGTSLAASDFNPNPEDTPFNPAIAQQHGSGLVDFVPRLETDGCIALHDPDLSPTVTGQYSLLLAGGTYLPQSASDSGTGLFLQLRSQAKQKYDESKLSVELGVDYWPVDFTPEFWFNDQDATLWPTYNSATGQSTSPGPAGSATLVGDWRWRVMTAERQADWQLVLKMHARHSAQSASLKPGLAHLAPDEPIAATTTTALAPHMHTGPHLGNGSDLSPIVIDTGSATVMEVKPTSAMARAAKVSPILTRLAAANAVVAALPTQPVTSSNFHISFRYRLVEVARPWLSANFLTAANWYMPGAPAGQFAGGTYAENARPFAFLPAKFLVIKDLTLQANWSDTDVKYLQNAAGLGPISLVDNQFENNVLTCPGMQIIGWFCQIVPALPPRSDPSVAPVAAG